jgi:hypothetical protein
MKYGIFRTRWLKRFNIDIRLVAGGFCFFFKPRSYLGTKNMSIVAKSVFESPVQKGTHTEIPEIKKILKIDQS